MTHLTFHNVSLQHSNGDVQFSNLHFSLPYGLTGLIGNNGVGKSLLVNIIKGSLKPSRGFVETSGKMFIYEQNAQTTIPRHITVADHFGAAAKLNALRRIEQSSVAEEDFQAVGDDWLFASNFNAQLKTISNSLKPQSALCELSGGELSKVLLSGLFNDAQQQGGILILDEPSNHLDALAKQWLVERLCAFKGKCLLISHDRLLLKQCTHIANLTKTSIALFEANFDTYEQQRLQQEEAQIRKFNDLQKQQKYAKENAQRDIEKAQQRCRQGIKKGMQGSLPKVLLGTRKSKAEKSRGSQDAQHQAKIESLGKQIQASKSDNVLTPIVFGFAEEQHKSKRLLSAINLTIPFIKKPLSMQVYQGEKWHLQGENGSGKSTLLSLLKNASIAFSMPSEAGKSNALQALNMTGQLSINVSICLLDQHLSLIRAEESMLDNLAYYCPHLPQIDLRTILASNGFRKDKVFQLSGLLSGGEKMRLSMLIASHQQNSLLLLDEPDNHLDMLNKQVLSDALSRFSGSFILVSHDQHFVDSCGITNTIY